MNKEAQNSIEKILGSYFSKKEISEYKKLLKIKPSEANLVSSLSNINKKQLSQTSSPSSEFQHSINILITLAIDNLEETNFYDFILQLSDVAIVNGEYQSAIELLQYLIKSVSKKEYLISFHSHGLYLLAKVYSRLSEWSKSISALNKAKRLFEKQKDFRGYVRCENLLGVIHLDYGKLDKAEKYFENCLSYLDISNDTNLMGMIEINLGVVNGMMGAYEESYNYFHRALVKFNKLKNILRIIELRHNLGLLHTNRGEYKLALAEIDQSINFANKINYISNLTISYLTKAFIYIQLNDLALANAFSDKSLELSYKLNDRLSVADNLKLKGIIERQSNNFSKAEIYFQTSLRINDELENKLNHAETSVELGILYKQMGKEEAALISFNSALNYYKSIKHNQEIERIQEFLKNLN